MAATAAKFALRGLAGSRPNVRCESQSPPSHYGGSGARAGDPRSRNDTVDEYVREARQKPMPRPERAGDPDADGVVNRQIYYACLVESDVYRKCAGIFLHRFVH